MAGPFLVLGAGGFAGSHLCARLAPEGEVAAPPRTALDLTDEGPVRDFVGRLRPRVVFHLAGFSSPRLSWERPREALFDNLAMTLNVLEAVRFTAPEAAVVLAGSGQVYAADGAGPVDEETAFAPLSPYAVSKAACDMLGAQYAAARGLRVMRMRPFNHAGPGQADEYVVSSLARQVAEAEVSGASEAVLHAGDITAARDFTDVRDVVDAYALAAAAAPGAYNVCSGSCTTVGELIEHLRDATELPIRHEVDPGLLRKHDARAVRGSHERLSAATGWAPRISIAQTVADTLDWWRGRLA